MLSTRSALNAARLSSDTSAQPVKSGGTFDRLCRTQRMTQHTTRSTSLARNRRISRVQPLQMP
jgi:hypothetical protein